MLSSMWISAPAGVTGQGSLVVRPGACGAAPAVVGRLRGLPAGRVAVTRVPDPAYVGAPTGTRGFDIDGFGITGRGSDLFKVVGVAVTTRHQMEQNGTTLGIHSSGRPRS